MHSLDRLRNQPLADVARIFARLHHRDGKPGYLKDIPRTLNYVLEVCSRYVELRPLEAQLRTLPVSP